MVPDPHGGKLVNRLLEGAECEKALEEARSLPAITVDADVVSDAVNIGTGAYSPLQGFMDRHQLASLMESDRLPDGMPWTVPILLDVTGEQARGLGDQVALLVPTNGHPGKPFAILHIADRFTFDKESCAQHVFGTTDPQHPGVAKLLSLQDTLLGGPIDLLEDPGTPFSNYAMTPQETRSLFEAKGWRTVVGFQTRNVPHLGHEYVQKTALTFVDGLFINPVIGRKKAGDFKDEVILSSYQALLDNYYPEERAVMTILRTEMRYAGPKEAIFHAIVRKNLGCSHFIVGRDHAGVGSYYDPYAAQTIFEAFPDLGITPMPFGAFFFCKRCGSVVNDKICPHGADERLDFSGTLLRSLITTGQMPEGGMIRPEVAEAILAFADPLVA